MKSNRSVTEQEVIAAFEDFAAEVVCATGRDVDGNIVGRPRFKGFRIVDALAAAAIAALEPFKEGDFQKALGGIVAAKAWLINAQRKYCLKSVQEYFNRQIENLKFTVDQDIYDSIQKHRKEFELVLIVLSGSFELEKVKEASTYYWLLLDAIEQAPKTQLEREANRIAAQLEALSQHKKEKKARQAAADERSREAQRIQDEGRKATRVATANTLQAQLMARLGVSM